MEKKINLIVNYLDGNISDSQLNNLKNWVEEDEANRKLFNEYMDIWQAGLLYKDDMFDSNKAYKKVNSKINKSYSIKRGLIFRIAAAVIVGIFIGAITISLIQNNFNHQNLTYHEIYVPLGAKSKINLPDGTQVWLNAGSKLTYSNKFNYTNREVLLEGEGYFDVAKNDRLTFEVNAADLKIKAVGTIFNVNAYPEEDVVKTVLIEGKINIQKQIAKRNSKVIELLPNQSATYYKYDSKVFLAQSDNNRDRDDEIEKTMPVKRGTIYLNKKVNSEIYTSWKDEYWIFKSEPLADLAKKIERRYNVIITFDSENLKSYKFSGSFKDETLEQVLTAIELSSPVNYSISGRNIVFKEDK